MDRRFALAFRVLAVGMPVSVLLFAANAALCTAIDMPDGMLRILSAMPLLTGCFVSAFLTGRQQRHKGIACGISASLLLTGIWYAVYCMYCGRLGMPWVMLPALVCGIAGGLLGVHREAPVPRRRMHRLIRCREQALLLPLLLHRPKKAVQDQTADG